jgi:hypothetical protein
MQGWEYLGVRLIHNADSGGIVVLDPQNLKGTPLNDLGRQGWEVVGVFRDNFWVLLKRPTAAPTGAAVASAAEAGANTVPPVSGTATVAGEAPAAGDNPLTPFFGIPDDDRTRALEQRLHV